MELELHKGGRVPQDEVLCTDGRVENEPAQGERTEVWKVQRTEGNAGRSANIDVAVEGELRKRVLSWGENIQRNDFLNAQISVLIYQIARAEHLYHMPLVRSPGMRVL